MAPDFFLPTSMSVVGGVDAAGVEFAARSVTADCCPTILTYVQLFSDFDYPGEAVFGVVILWGYKRHYCDGSGSRSF